MDANEIVRSLEKRNPPIDLISMQGQINLLAERVKALARRFVMLLGISFLLVIALIVTAFQR